MERIQARGLTKIRPESDELTNTVVGLGIAIILLSHRNDVKTDVCYFRF